MLQIFMDPTKIAEYVRLYKLAVVAVDDQSILPARTDDQIKKLISKAEWLMFGKEGVDRVESANSPKPNVWLRIEDTTYEIGLYYNTKKAMDNARNLLHQHNSEKREQLLAEMSKLDDSYTTKLQRKTKENHFRQSPIYTDILVFKANEIHDIQKIKDLFAKSEEVEREGKIKKKNGQVGGEYPSLDLIYVECKDDADFQKKIKEVFNIYKIVENVKSEEQYDREVKRRQAEERSKAEEEEKVKREDLHARQAKWSEDDKRNREKLDNMNLVPEKWRELRAKWLEENPRPV